MKKFLKKISQYTKKCNRTKIKNSFVTNYSVVQLFNCSVIIFILTINLILPAQAFEDYIIITNGKLTDIKIENNTIVDVYPLITIMNNKNTLMVSPLKEGKTRVSVLKNKKEEITFNIEVYEHKTKIDDVEGFEIMPLDPPFEENMELDEPPTLKEIN